MGIRDENIEEDDVSEELEALREPPRKPPNSVAYSGLVYVDGYIAKLITDVGCETCAMLVTTNKTSSPLYHLLRQQEAYDLHYPKPELLSMLDTIVTFFEKAVKYLPRTKILETLQLTVEPYLEDSPLLDCPEAIHAAPSGSGRKQRTEVQNSPDAISTVSALQSWAAKDRSRRARWIANIRIGKAVTPTMTVCSRHFARDDFFFPADQDSRNVLALRGQSSCARALRFSDGGLPENTGDSNEDLVWSRRIRNAELLNGCDAR
ncbi:hypothetical protein HPB52_023542 [Rhipicephalus sanguineus]|uniref:THAP-type domain-containing protein n=1 Tax=Rhipicephalus sanguineus TaxID=34632 RepID=A0A9D4PJ64_RHISA|nr:hypothetical protein HPB52_023542 [Rhipicephalus sanguineus]